MTIIIILLGVLIAFNIWNLFTLRSIRNRRSNEQQIGDARYYELKSKQEFLLTSFYLMVGIAAFLGFNSLDSIKENIKEDFDDKVSVQQNTIDELSDDLAVTDSTVNTYQRKIDDNKNLLSQLEDRQNRVQQSTHLSEQQASAILKRIQELNNNNLIKQEIYFVPNLLFETSFDDDIYQKYYFKDLRTILGDKLPLFETPPSILPISNETGIIQVKKVTSESFELGVFSYEEGSAKVEKVPGQKDKYTFKFHLMITEVPK